MYIYRASASCTLSEVSVSSTVQGRTVAAGGFGAAAAVYPYQMTPIQSARSVVQEIVSALHKVSCYVLTEALS